MQNTSDFLSPLAPVTWVFTLHLWPLWKVCFFSQPPVLPSLSHLIQNSAEVHRAQSSECIIWLLVFNFPWKVWSVPADTGLHLAVLPAFGTTLLWAEASSWQELLLLFFQHTLLSTLPCWLADSLAGWLCLLFGLWVTAGHEGVRSKRTTKTFILRSPGSWIHKLS